MTPRDVRRLERAASKWVKTGERVHYHPVIGEAHDGRVYEVGGVGEINGLPVAWLNGKSGIVSLAALSKAVPA